MIEMQWEKENITEVHNTEKDKYEGTNHICQPNTGLCHLIHTLKHLCLGQPESKKHKKNVISHSESRDTG